MNYLEINKKLWDNKVPVHFAGDFYEVKAFLAGKNVLTPIELAALGDVSGKKMLHLQCHFGLDSLCWERLGAKVTGADFSSKAIKTARKLAKTAGLKAKFVESDIYSLRENFPKKGRFDMVFTSYGTIGWLPDLREWAATIAFFLKKNGVFFIADFHPFLWTLDFQNGGFAYDYFKTGPIIQTNPGTYADPNAPLLDTEIGWNHSFDEIFEALSGVGLVLESFREFDFSPYPCFPNTTERAPGEFVLKSFEGKKMPHVYAIKMRKK